LQDVQWIRELVIVRVSSPKHPELLKKKEKEEHRVQNPTSHSWRKLDKLADPLRLGLCQQTLGI